MREGDLLGRRERERGLDGEREGGREEGKRGREGKWDVPC